MKKIILIAITIFIASCDRHPQSISLILNGDSTFWDYYDNPKKMPIGSYLFKKNGECIRYVYTKYNDFYVYNDDDVLRPNTWLIIDSTIIIRGLERHIIYITKDSMKLLNPKTSDTEFFRRKESNTY